MNPKTKAILDQVKILAQTYPDFVYPNPIYNFPCQYNTGVNPKYPGLRGCIIGQAARKAGIDTSDWDVSPNETTYHGTSIRYRIKDRLGEDRYSSDAYFLQRIQNLQDQGTPWGEAYAEAMDEAE